MIGGGESANLRALPGHDSRIALRRARRSRCRRRGRSLKRLDRRALRLLRGLDLALLRDHAKILREEDRAQRHGADTGTEQDFVLPRNARQLAPAMGDTASCAPFTAAPSPQNGLPDQNQR